MIIPAVLDKNFSDFETQSKKLTFAPLIQIDIKDGVFVPEATFAEIDKINNLNLKNQWELHLMVMHPLAELKKWQTVKNIKRVIFHLECEDNPQDAIRAIKENGWEVGVAINPDTSERELLPYLNSIDEVLFMNVYPGQQGAPTVSGIKEKIINFKKILETKEIDLPIALDGGINKNNIAKIKTWGVDNFCVGSAIVMSPDPAAAYAELNNLI